MATHKTWLVLERPFMISTLTKSLDILPKYNHALSAAVDVFVVVVTVILLLMLLFEKSSKEI